jgi:hypothetical protein
MRFDGDFIVWDSKYPAGSPTHDDSPFAFKPFCFAAAAQAGYELVLWLDASICIKQSLDPLFAQIEEKGFLFFEVDHSVGEYCKDPALGPLGITREESFAMPSCWACAIGLNLRAPMAQQFLAEWKRLAVDGVTFPGAKWSGVRGWDRTVSADPRVKGHRHDQTAASVIAHRLQMRPWLPRATFNTFLRNDRAYIRPAGESPWGSAWRRWRTMWQRWQQTVVTWRDAPNSPNRTRL